MTRHITLALLLIATFSTANLQPRQWARAQEPTPYTVAFGETLNALAQRSGESVTSLAQINGLTRRDSLFAGQKINLPAPVASRVRLHRVQSNETLMQIAARYGMSPILLRRMNDLPCASCLVPGQQLRVAVDEADAPASDSLDTPLLSIQLSSDRPKQGDVFIIRVATQNADHVGATFGGYRVNFVVDGTAGAGGYIGMIGVDAMLQPGTYPLVISATTATGDMGKAVGTVQVQRGNYVFENVAISPKLVPLLDQKLNDSEEAKVKAVYSQFTTQQWWAGPFEIPVEGKLLAGYGNRRVYNGVNLGSYHSGYDISSTAGQPVHAAAPGRVAFVQRLDIRGLTVIIDHGFGVFTGYFHLSRADVKPGQLVNEGDVIAAVGTTGRSQGNHLHFDLAVGGVTVDPGYWMRVALP